MPAISTKASGALIPTEVDSARAKQAVQALAAHAGMQESIKIQILDEGKPQETVEIPAPAFRLLVESLAHLAQGHSVTLAPLKAEISTQEAADFLNVSRPYLVRLLDDRKIPHRKVGKHRRVLLRDILAYKAREDAERQMVLDELTREAQVCDMGY